MGKDFNNYILLSHSSIIDCYAARTGGGIMSVENMHFTIESSTIHNCSSIVAGGGMYLYWTHHYILIYETNWTENTANMGGAIFTSTVVNQLVIAGSNFIGNTAYNEGGGAILLEGNNPQLVVTDTSTADHLQVIETSHPYINPTITVEGEGEVYTMFYNYTVVDMDAISFILQFDTTSDLGSYDELMVWDSSGVRRLWLGNGDWWPGYQIPSLRLNGSQFTVEMWGYSSHLKPATSTTDGRYGFKLFITPILLYTGKLTTFRDNFARNGAGGGVNMMFFVAFPNLINVIFSNNTANTGGALSIGTTSAGVNLENVIFEYNTAITHGGSIHIDASNAGLIVYNCSFHYNTAYSNGGAIAIGLSNGHMKIILMLELRFQFINCDFLENQSNHGGAIYIDRANYITFEQCLFQRNKAIKSGGSINIIQENTVIMHNTMFKQNIALLSGGAIQSTLENVLQLENVLLTKNYAGTYNYYYYYCCFYFYYYY